MSGGDDVEEQALNQIWFLNNLNINYNQNNKMFSLLESWQMQSSKQKTSSRESLQVCVSSGPDGRT